MGGGQNDHRKFERNRLDKRKLLHAFLSLEGYLKSSGIRVSGAYTENNLYLMAQSSPTSALDHGYSDAVIP